MNKYKKAIEIFGKPDDLVRTDEIIKSEYQCPFIDKKCTKQSRIINYPMGICSVCFNNREIIICPERFKENEIVFKNIADEFFGGTDNTMVFNEVKLKMFGSFDFILVKHKPLSSEIEDFVIIEFQSDSTTGTGKLVNNLKDIFSNKRVDHIYTFGMNTYNTIKLSFIQMLMKGQVAEYWAKKIIWVMQDYIFSNMLNRFHLPRNDFDVKKMNYFFLYSLVRPKDKFTLQLDDRYSYTINELKQAFVNEHIPKLEDFIKILENKARLKLEIK